MACINGKTRYISTISRKNRGLWTVYFGLSLHIFQHGSSLSLENVCDSWCMHQTGFSSAALCHKVNLPSCVARRPLCHKVNPPSCVARQPLCHKVNLPRCEARRRHLIMTCNIFGTRQTNTLTLCYLLGKTYKPAHSSATLDSLKSTRSTKLLEKLLKWVAHTFHWRLWQD